MYKTVNETSLAVLGKLAKGVRSFGLEALLNVARDCFDEVFMNIRYPPLKVRISNTIELHGLLRHRSFLAGLCSGTYESLLQRLLKRSLEVLGAGTVIVDGGAHIGFYSLTVSRVLRFEGNILSFEPDPHNYRTLTFNLKMNRCNNVIPFKKALSNTTGRGIFYQSSGTISSSLYDRCDVGSVKLKEIETTNLDLELQDFIFRSLVLKLDIEGAEVYALRGSKNILENTNKVICFIEMNPSALRSAGFAPAHLMHELQVFNTCHFINEPSGRLIVASEVGTEKKGNLFCTKGIVHFKDAFGQFVDSQLGS